MKFRLNLYFICLLSVVMVLLSCSTKRDGTTYRWYHNTTAHYNGYFNAEEILRKNNDKVKAAHKEDFDKILPIFVYADAEAAKSSYPDMEKAITKCEKVIRRHTISNESKKDKKRPKLNKWIDDNHMVVGKAYFYKRNYAKAAELFNYVNRKYKDPEIVAVTNTWLAKTYTAQEEYGKAIQALERVKLDDDKITKKIKADYYQAYADVLFKQGKTEKSAEKLKEAIKNISRKKDRARPYFILAQMYQSMNSSSDALANYEMVLKSRPVYELEFYSRINKALSFSRQGGSSNEIKKELHKMLKDDKNISYRDQIYYALGDIALEEQARAEAIDYFEKSLIANKDNPKQKAKTFLKLADLYFNERQYVNAQLYYDSTLKTIAEDHERFLVVKTRAESLTELVASLDAIALNDSLKQICDLPPAERDKKLEKAAQALAQKAEEQRRKDELAAQAANQAAVQGINGTFWCYNENLRTKGKEIFLDKWGARPLKDNWRLQSKLATSFGPGEEAGALADTSTTAAAKTKDDKYKTPTADELKSTLPCADDAKMKKLVEDAAEGYYNAGIIYKEKLNDVDNAISTWEELLANMDESDYHPTTYYQLFRTWLSKEQTKGYTKNPFCSTCNSQYWGDEIKSKYPGSDWAMLVDNPGYLDVQDMKNSQESEAYKRTYNLYTGHNYYAAMAACDSVITGQPDNHLRCKYRLLKAVCVGYTETSYGNKETYQKELNALIQACPGTEEATRAQELLKPFTAGNTGDAKGDPKTDESNSTTSEQNPEVKPQDPESPFKYDAAAEHYMAVLMPLQGSDINQVKAAISDFNTENFNSAQLKVSNNLLNKDYHLVLVKSFKAMADARDYISTFKSNSDKLKAVNQAGNTIFLISKQNYIALFKNKDTELYMQFYEANYQ